GEVKEYYSGGAAAAIILVLSAAKFFSVVSYYMHLKFDNKLFTGIFVFPAVLATLVIGGMLLLFHVVHGEATQIHGELELNAQKQVAPATPVAH
ncbi:MAG TPA: cytochrome C oxidase subunit IV family protein, partial [Longimicrobiaceae bacterium]